MERRSCCSKFRERTTSRDWPLRFITAPIFASNPAVFKPQHCRFQDFREEPQTIRYGTPHEGQWKLFLYRMTGGENTRVEVDVIQVPAGDNQKPLERIANQDDQVGLGLAARRELMKKAEPVKIEGVQAVGALAAGASVDTTQFMSI